jgi:hypothetical protein
MKYYMKRTLITAVQWFKAGDHPEVSLLQMGTSLIPYCSTKEAALMITPGDWIVTNETGESYPCKPDIFAKTYVEVLVPGIAPGK